jgi:hypothetical protein
MVCFQGKSSCNSMRNTDPVMGVVADPVGRPATAKIEEGRAEDRAVHPNTAKTEEGHEEDKVVRQNTAKIDKGQEGVYAKPVSLN